MNQSYPEYWSQYFTATIYEWKHLLADDHRKDIVIDSLRFLVTEKRVELNAFVIMSNHLHIIWQPLFGFTPGSIQASFMKYTGLHLKRSLEINNVSLLTDFKVNKHDREYQIWKRESLSIELRTPAVFYQKLEYIHYNPVQAGLCTTPEDYYYSSARFYHDGTDRFGIMTHSSGK